MIPRANRMGLFGATAALFGVRRARRLSAKWKRVLGDSDLVADLTVLGYLAEAHTNADGTSLSALDMARREGARQAVLAIFARAEITEAEIKQAIEELNHEPPDDDPTMDDDADAYHARARR